MQSESTLIRLTLTAVAIACSGHATSQAPGAGNASLHRSSIESSYAELVQELDNRVRFSAFADLTLGTEFGNFANQSDRALFDSDGASAFPLNSYGNGFGAVGADFLITADIADDLVFQGEINIQTDRGGSSDIDLDAERFYVDQRFSDAFNVQAGLFFTPIGYHNRFLYSRAWLMHSIQVPDLFEEDLNLVPTHTIGVNIHGKVELGGHTFGYIAGIGNGRAVVPNENILARDSNDKEVTLLLEWHVPEFNEFVIGVSGWTGEVDTYDVGPIGTTVDISTATQRKFRESGFNPYITYYGEDFNFLGEFVYAKQGGSSMSGLTAELSLNLRDNTVHPYIRYDYTDLPSGDQGPYYGLRLDGNMLTKHFIPQIEVLMVGFNYDVNPNTRLKFEYAHHLDGARERHALVMQLAYGF